MKVSEHLSHFFGTSSFVCIWVSWVRTSKLRPYLAGQRGHLIFGFGPSWNLLLFHKRSMQYQVKKSLCLSKKLSPQIARWYAKISGKLGRVRLYGKGFECLIKMALTMHFYLCDANCTGAQTWCNFLKANLLTLFLSLTVHYFPHCTKMSR